MVFYRELAKVVLFIDDVVTDRIDGVIGLAPNSTNSDENTLLLTGELNIELNNLFKSAKQMELHWRNYLQRSQMLDVGVTLPYLANTKLGINGEFELNKFDTLFVNLKSKLSFRYQQQGNNYVQLYYQNISSNIVSFDTSNFRNSLRIPSNNPYRIDNYGIELFQRSFDFLPNPRKGYELNANVALGQKTLLRNTLVDAVKFINTETGDLISIYDTLNTKNSLRGTVEIGATAFLPIKKVSTIKQDLNLKMVLSPNIFFNELYNFGGFSSLRGFDENDIFASKLLFYNIEYRYLIGEQSNVGLFFNTAVIENKVESEKLIYDVPIGFGALANIQVGSGILSLAYALGKQLDNPIQLNAAKFHFGIINYF